MAEQNITLVNEVSSMDDDDYFILAKDEAVQRIPKKHLKLPNSAADIVYDNGSSGATSTNAQDVIDEIMGEIKYLKENGVAGDTTWVTVTLTNQNGTSTIVASEGDEVPLMFTFSSIEDEAPTGNGNCKITVNGVLKVNLGIPQGLNTIDIAPHLYAGSNAVVVTCTDMYGTSRRLVYDITVIKLALESSFDATVAYDSDIAFKYIPYGALEKSIHFVIDGVENSVVVTSISGKQMTKNIPAMSHGSHILEVYAVATLNNTELRSNTLTYDIICIEEDDPTPIISSVYTVEKLSQGEQVSIPYVVYDPTKLACDVALTIYTLSSGSEVVYSTQSVVVDRSQWLWNTRSYPIGTVYFRIKYGDIDKTHQIVVTESGIDIEAETNDLELFLSSEGRSNNESDPSHWTYNEINTSFQNFNWNSVGWINDEHGDACLRLNGDARAEIAFKPFASDLRVYGKTIELEFAVRDVHNRDAVIISCMSGGIGFEVNADTAKLVSEQSEVFCNYKEEEKVKVSFVVESRTDYRLLSIYLNGVLSDIVQYPTTDNFQQNTPVNITVGSSDCGVDLYVVRSYATALSASVITNNYIADMNDIVQKTEVFEENDIYDDYGNISYMKLKDKNSCMIIVGELPKSKGDKKKVVVKYYDEVDSALDFVDNDVEIDVQGTSSQWYVRKNWKMKCSTEHHIDFDHLPAKVICIKVDYAEATGTHNTQNANFVHRLYSEPIPPQAEEPKCRTTIYGKPILLFHQEDESSDPVFYGKMSAVVKLSLIYGETPGMDNAFEG